MKPALRVVPDATEGAVLYIRQSVTRRVRDAQGRKTTELDTVSPELQETAGRDYCARKGYPVVAVVVDLNRTGRTLRRRSVQEAIGYIERGEARVIVVWKWSRLARNRRDFAVTCDYIEEKVGGRVESSTEPIDITTAVGRLNRGMLAEFAAFESDRQSEIAKEVVRARVIGGLPATGRSRFGYVNVGKLRFKPDPTTAPVLASMYRQFIAGQGYKTIARWLNDHGYRNTAGRFFDEGNVKDVLDSGFGAGKIRHEAEYVDGVHDAVITPEEWATYLRLRGERAALPSRTKGSRYVLAGLTKCGICGAAMRPTSPDRYGHIWYKCRYRTLTECPNPWVKLPAVEQAVLGWLRGLVAEVDAAAENARRLKVKVVTHKHRADSLARQIQQQDDALTRLTVDRARQLVPEPAYIAARDEILGVRSRLAAEHAEAVRATKAGAEFDAQAYRGLLEEWETIPVAARREMLRRLLARVRVWGKPFRVEPVPHWENDATPTTSRPDGLSPARPHGPGRKALTDQQAAEIRIRNAAGESQTALAKEYGVSISTVHWIVHGRSYRSN